MSLNSIRLESNSTSTDSLVPGGLDLSSQDEVAISKFLDRVHTDSVQEARAALEVRNGFMLENALKAVLRELPAGSHSVIGICHQERQAMLLPHKGRAFFDAFVGMLNSEEFYGRLIKTLRKFNDPSAEKCDKAYQTTIDLLKNHRSKKLAPTRFSWIIGQARKEWARISRIAGNHKYCGCHSVDRPHNEWPKDSQRLTKIDQIAQHPDKRFALAGCDWGGGHRTGVRAAGNIIAEKLNGEIYTIDIPNHILPPSQDRVKNSILGKVGLFNSTSEFVNTLAAHKAIALTNFLRGAPSAPDLTLGGKKLPFILRSFLEVSPDFVITSYNLHNEPIITAAKLLGIPCLHIPTDIRGPVETRSEPRDYVHFKMGFAVNEVPDLMKAKVTNEQAVLIGLPVRPQLLKQAQGLGEVAQLKKKWNVEPGKRVILIMGGENGLPSSVPSLLSKIYKDQDPNIQVFVLCGRTEITKQGIESLKLPFVKALGFQGVEEMRELYAMASAGGFIISKSGGGTVAEALHMGVPMMIDAMPTPIFGFGFKHAVFGVLNWAAEKAGASRELPWETDNGEFMIERNMASRFHNEQEFQAQFHQWMERPVHQVYEYDGPNFSETLPKTVLEMLDKVDHPKVQVI